MRNVPLMSVVVAYFLPSPETAVTATPGNGTPPAFTTPWIVDVPVDAGWAALASTPAAAVPACACGCTALCACPSFAACAIAPAHSAAHAPVKIAAPTTALSCFITCLLYTHMLLNIRPSPSARQTIPVDRLCFIFDSFLSDGLWTVAASLSRTSPGLALVFPFKPE